jgi:8-oxo-dGTP diphosphatase
MTSQSVIGVIFSRDRQKVLLVKRRDVPVWVLPGGGVNANEHNEAAIKREVLEETGYDVKVTKKIGRYYPINRLAKVTDLFECSIISGTASISDETKEVQFFYVHKLPKLIPPPFDEWISDAHNNYQYVIQKKLKQINYLSLIKNAILHPILVLRFLLSRMGFYINT